MVKLYFFSLFILIFLSACNSDYADLSPLSGRHPFITQLGKFTQSPNGNNLGSENCSDNVLDEKYETSYCFGSVAGSFGKVSDGSIDTHVTKFDRKGKVLWVRQFASSNGAEDTCNGAGIDQDGNIYCGGSTKGFMEANPDRYDGTERQATDSDYDAFVMKLNSNGDLLWVKQFGTAKDDYCSNIAVSPEGNVYCGSRTKGALGDEVTGGSETHNEALDANGVDQNSDIYMAKISTYGQVLWKRQIGANAYPIEADFADSCGGVAIDQLENVTCAGNTQGSLGETNGGSDDLVLWSLTKDGNFRYLKQIGQETENNTALILDTSTSDQGYDIVSDPYGNLYLVGLTLSDLILNNADNKQDGFILKFDPDGNLLDGAQAHFSGHQSFQAVHADKNEEVYLLGSTSSATYGPLGGSADIFIVKLKKDLSYKWYKQFGSDSGLDSGGIESALGIAQDKAGNIYIGGFTNGNFGETNASNSSDIFMLRMTNDGFFK